MFLILKMFPTCGKRFVVDILYICSAKIAVACPVAGLLLGFHRFSQILYD